jgi:ABC-type multidrug transport system fused ATPase/permease subunit
VDQEQKSRERSFISELVPDWRPSREQKLWAIRLTVAVVLVFIAVALLGVVLWRVLDTYINPQTATERKDLVQSFAVVAAGAVGSVSALAAVGNLYISRRNLQQQQDNEFQRRAQEFETEAARRKRELEVENQRAQDAALQAYLDQMSQLLTDKDRPLHRAQSGDSLSALARVRTLTVLARLDSSRKGSVVQFLYESALIPRDRGVVDLTGADLTRADLGKVSLGRADLSGAILSEADMSEAVLEHARRSTI